MNLRLLLPLALMAALLLPVAPAGGSGFSVSMDGNCVEAQGDRIVVGRGESRRNDIVMVGGSVKVDGEVSGDVIVVMGKLELSGRVKGDVVVVMTDLRLMDGAVVEGDLVRVLGSIQRTGEVRVRGEKSVGIGLPTTFPIALGFPWLVINLGFAILGLIILVLIVGLFPNRVENMERFLGADPSRWFTAPLIGLSTLVIMPLVTVALAISVVGIILIPFLWTAYWLVGYFGIAAVYLALGRRFLRNFRSRDAKGLLGPVILVYVLVSVPAFIPCLGLLICFVLSWFGVGLALQSCFGRVGAWAGLGGGSRRSVRGPAPPVAEEE